MRCPLCRAALVTPGRALLRCERCRTNAHADCARELNGGRCGVHGCERGLAVVVLGQRAGVATREVGEGTSRWSRGRAAALLALGAGVVAAALAMVPPPHRSLELCPCDGSQCDAPHRIEDLIEDTINTDEIR